MRPAALLVAALLAVALGPLPSSPVAASCAGPVLSITGPTNPTALRPGDDITVGGRSFVDGCDDTGGQDGVFGCDREHEVVTRMVDVQLVLRQRGREWPLGTADAAGSGDITWRVRVPDGPRPGRARLVAGTAQALRVAIPSR